MMTLDKRTNARTRHPLPLGALLAAAALTWGACKPAGMSEVESPILDVRPARLELGEQLIVELQPARVSSRGVPAVVATAPLRAKAATTVVLQGTFTQAEGKSWTDQLELPATVVASRVSPAQAERVLVRMDRGLRQQLGWVRFAGRVGVSQQDANGQPQTVWTDAGRTTALNLFPPTMRGVAGLLSDWLVTDRLLRWVGVSVEPTAGGLKVTSTTNHKPSESPMGRVAGIEDGDVITRVGEASVQTLDELVDALRAPRDRARLALAVQRDGQEKVLSLPVVRRPFTLPVAAVDLAVMLLFALVIVAVSFVIAGGLTWVERRVAARMQYRVGPNRVGPQGIIQWLADGIKLVLKEDIVPDATDRPLFKFAPYLVLMGFLGTFIVIPFGQFLIIADLNVGLLWLMAITGFVSIGLMMAGWSSNNKWSLLGGMRSAAQIISYEIPTGLALMVPVVLAGTLSTHELVERQGGMPWEWFAFNNPLAFACFFIYFVSALAEGNRTPFDLPEAESELVAGYNIEYSGWRFAVFFLSEWGNLFVIGAVAATVYLGGWQIPGVSPAAHATHWAYTVLGLLILFGKAMAIVFVIVWIRWTLPRFRVDQMMNLCWKYFVPWSFATILFSALWIWLAPEAVQLGVKVATFVACGLGGAYLFFSRVFYSWETNPEKRYNWNPFI